MRRLKLHCGLCMTIMVIQVVYIKPESVRQKLWRKPVVGSQAILEQCRMRLYLRLEGVRLITLRFVAWLHT